MSALARMWRAAAREAVAYEHRTHEPRWVDVTTYADDHEVELCTVCGISRRTPRGRS